MKTPRSLTTAIAGLLLMTMAPAPAAGEPAVNAVTSFTSWEREDGDGDAASQHLQLHATRPLGEYTLDFSGYGRATSVEDPDGDRDDQSRLYSLTVGLTSGGGGTSVLLGRQFVPSLTGPDQIDGLTARQSIGDWSLAARYGHISEISPSDGNDDRIMGLGLAYMVRRGMFFSLDYSRSFDDEALLREEVAVDWTYSWHRYTKAYFFLNWDLMSRTVHEALLGTRLFFSDFFTWTIEYSQNVQQFDSDSIYSVFAVDAAQTTSFSFLLTPGRNTRYTWEYALESYKGGSGGRWYSVGGHWSPGSSTYDLSLEQHTGYGGDLTEVRMGTSHQLLPGVRVSLGGDLSRTENEGEETVKSFAAHTGLMWSPTDALSASFRYELAGDDVLVDDESTSRISLSWEL